MTKSCDIARNTDIKENQVQVTKEKCSISQKLISDSNSSSKSNKKIKKFIIANLNVNSLISKLDELKVIG